MTFKNIKKLQIQLSLIPLLLIMSCIEKPISVDFKNLQPEYIPPIYKFDQIVVDISGVYWGSTGDTIMQLSVAADNSITVQNSLAFKYSSKIRLLKNRRRPKVSGTAHFFVKSLIPANAEGLIRLTPQPLSVILLN